MPERFVEQGEEARESQNKAFLWVIVFLFLFTCSIVLIFAIIHKVDPELLQKQDSYSSSEEYKEYDKYDPAQNHSVHI